MRTFQPARILANHLKYPQKFLLISLLFALPLGMLSYFLVEELNTKIGLSQKELDGTAYLQTLQRVDEQVLQNQVTSYYPESLSFSKIASEIAVLQVVDKKYRTLLKTSEKFGSVQTTWQTIAPNLKTASPPDRSSAYEQLHQKIQALRSHVGDTSNLVLDPDLDTYYLMDAILLKLPQLQAILAETIIICKRTKDQNNISNIDRTRLLILLGTFKETSSELSANLQVAISKNRTKSILPKISLALQAWEKNCTELHLLLENSMSKNIPIDNILNSADRSFQSSSLLWKVVISELESLLAQRISNFAQRKNFVIVTLWIVLSLAAYFFVGFYQSVMHTISQLQEAEKNMRTGQNSANFTLETKDELAEVIHTFNAVATALAQSEERYRIINDRLKSDNIRMSAELDITRRIQKMILPKEEELTNIKNLDIAGFMQPADEVGGDYYDVLSWNDHIKIGIGDVTGHGLESGVLMIMAQTAVSTLSRAGETDPARFFQIVNHVLYQNVQRMQSEKTMTLILLDYYDNDLYISGQHEEVLVMHNGGEIERIDTIDLGFPIALMDNIQEFVHQYKVSLHSGDVVVLYTDGITEAENPQKEQFGMDRLCDVLVTHAQVSAKSIRIAIIETLQNFIGEQHVYDDITLVVIKQK